MKPIRRIAEYSRRLAHYWVFWFCLGASGLLALVFETLLPNYQPARVWYILIPAVGFFVAGAKLHLEDQGEIERLRGEIEKFRAQTGIPNPAALALRADRQVYAQIQELMQTNDMLAFLRQTDFEGSFDTQRLRGMHDSIYFSELPESKFVDEGLELARQSLETNLRKFQAIEGQHTSPVPLSGGWNRVHDPYAGDWGGIFDRKSEAELETLHIQAMEMAVELNRTASEICESYAQLVQLAKKKLGV